MLLGANPGPNHQPRVLPGVDLANRLTDDNYEDILNEIRAFKLNGRNSIHIVFSDMALSLLNNDRMGTPEFKRLMSSLLKEFPDFLKVYLNLLLRQERFHALIVEQIKEKMISVSDLANHFHNLLEKKGSIYTHYWLTAKLIENINNSIPELISNDPYLKNRIEKHKEAVTSFITDEHFLKKYSRPVVIDGDNNNPRCCKYGGAVAHLPNEGPPLCPSCHTRFSHICQIYVKSLPEYAIEMFPEDKRDCLIQCLFCNTCYLELLVKTFFDEEIDKLVYTADALIQGYTYNDPKLVIEWVTDYMLPTSGSQKCITNELERIPYIINAFDVAEKFNSEKNPSDTYLCGYPYFIQGDDSPQGTELLMQFSQSEASTAMWGDSGTAQLWMATGDDFGEFTLQYACC